MRRRCWFGENYGRTVSENRMPDPDRASGEKDLSAGTSQICYAVVREQPVATLIPERPIPNHRRCSCMFRWSRADAEKKVLMTSRPQDSQDQALADTRIEYKHNEAEASRPQAQGCVLQIYPVPAAPGLVPLAAGRSILGRDPACHVPVDDTSVSRMHAAVEWTDGAWSLADLNSTNGTWVGDVQVTDRVPLTGGELIRLGNTTFRFLLAADQEAQYHAIVQDLLTRDALTGAYNRGYLIPLLNRELNALQAQGDRLSVILIDVDRFKTVNDTCGHLVGDEVLRTMCERIRQVLDRTHSLCRLGGDEFTVVCPSTSSDLAVPFAELIRQEIGDQPFATQAGQLRVTCSIGVAGTDGLPSPTVDELLSEADRALYDAKEAGRDCVRCPGRRRKRGRHRRTRIGRSSG